MHILPIPFFSFHHARQLRFDARYGGIYQIGVCWLGVASAPSFDLPFHLKLVVARGDFCVYANAAEQQGYRFLGYHPVLIVLLKNLAHLRRSCSAVSFKLQDKHFCHFRVGFPIEIPLLFLSDTRMRRLMATCGETPVLVFGSFSIVVIKPLHSTTWV